MRNVQHSLQILDLFLGNIKEVEDGSHHVGNVLIGHQKYPDIKNSALNALQLRKNWN